MTHIQMNTCYMDPIVLLEWLRESLFKLKIPKLRKLKTLTFYSGRPRFGSGFSGFFFRVKRSNPKGGSGGVVNVALYDAGEEGFEPIINYEVHIWAKELSLGCVNPAS